MFNVFKHPKHKHRGEKPPRPMVFLQADAQDVRDGIDSYRIAAAEKAALEDNPSPAKPEGGRHKLEASPRRTRSTGATVIKASQLEIPQ